MAQLDQNADCCPDSGLSLLCFVFSDVVRGLQLVSLQEKAGRLPNSSLALEAIKVRLVLIYGVAADFLRHCFMLHGYCSYPPGTGTPSPPPPPASLFHLDTPSLFSPPTLFGAHFVQLVPLRLHPTLLLLRLPARAPLKTAAQQLPPVSEQRRHSHAVNHS